MDDSTKTTEDTSRNLQPCDPISSPAIKAESQTVEPDTELQSEKPSETKEEGPTTKHSKEYSVLLRLRWI